jgi:hypothetical protein
VTIVIVAAIFQVRGYQVAHSHRTARLAAFLVLAMTSVAAGPAARALAGGHVPGDYFGAAVAMSGVSEIVAAAPGASDATGVVSLYALSDKTWHKQATFTDPADVTGDEFGNAVAASGNTVVIGAPGTNDARGRAYVYHRSGLRWRLQVTLGYPFGAIGDEFGSSVAVSGGVVIVGAPGARNGVFNPKNAGTVYVYTRRGTWGLRLKLADPANRSEDSFGSDLALSAGTLVVGAPGVRNHSGSAYIYTGKGSAWHLLVKLPDPSRIADDFFGASVAISGAIAVVGAPAAVNVAGLAYIYGRTGSTWRRLARLTDPSRSSSDWFGTAVAVSNPGTGIEVLVGDPHSDARPDPQRCGAAFEFTRRRGAWRERAKVENPGCARNDWFGAAVALVARTAVIGAFGKDNNAGAVYFLTLPRPAPRVRA